MPIQGLPRDAEFGTQLGDLLEPELGRRCGRWSRGRSTSARSNICAIEEHWDETLRLAASIRASTVSASTMLRKLAGYPR
jgi:hypothetical protein